MAGTVAPAREHGAVRPLLSRGQLVTVDGHPVCEVCGTAAAPGQAARWAHVPPGRAFPRGSRWFAQVSWAELRGLRSYAEFAARYPWTAHPELCGGVITSEADWREGVRRLRSYHSLLTSARRHRVLRGAENPYLALARVLAGASAGGRDEADLSWSVPGGLGSVLNLPARRRELAALFSWAIPADGALAVLSRYAPLIEVGAGAGYWAGLLRARGVDVAATDLAPPRRPWTTVAAASAAAAARAPDSGGRTLFLCWPPHDDDGASYAALRAYRGEVVAYLGGGPGGPAGTVRFHRELTLNWHPAEQVAVPNWPGLRDRLVVYRRNPVRRPLALRDRCVSCQRFLPTGAAGRCDWCFARQPPAMALRVNGHRVEYPREVVDAMPAGLRLALERSTALIRPPG
ncbi:MAG TPA: hypothetical protein VH589_28825 [Trebonia sp.]